jgi:pimeloyl-ACP methyl ester carboxylesterase
MTRPAAVPREDSIPTPPAAPALPEQGRNRGKNRRNPRRSGRGLRAAAAVVLAVAALVAVSTLTNMAFEAAERGSVPAYGERVAVAGGHVNVDRHGAAGPTIVMLTGYGTSAPGLDFAPLIRQLDEYRVVVVEGFGYGYSDLEAPPRTVENIAAELHEALAALEVEQPYVLLGHSIAGIYSLYYANQYPGEVSAVVGIDASVPGQMNGLAGQDSPVSRLVATSGLLRAAGQLIPSLVEPDGNAFTAAEREQIRLMTYWNYSNPAVLDEAAQGERNFAAVQDLTYPDDLPVLSFIKQDGSQEGWRELHEQQLENVRNGDLVVLDGGHYLHWTHAEELGSAIRGFLDSNGLEE